MDKKGGFISTIILGIIALALLKYFFNWDIFDALTSDRGRSTIGYIRDLLNTIWSYISVPVMFIWSQVLWPVVQFIWEIVQALLESGRGETSSQ